MAGKVVKARHGTHQRVTRIGVHVISETMGNAKPSVAGNAGQSTALIAATIARERMDKVTRNHAKSDKHRITQTAAKAKVVVTMVVTTTTMVAEKGTMVATVAGVIVEKEDGFQTRTRKAGIGTRIVGTSPGTGTRPKRQIRRSLKRRTQV